MRGAVIVVMVFCKNWAWVFLFCFATIMVYSQSMKKKKAYLAETMFRLEEMEKGKILCMQEKEQLSLRLASQSDPAWIEMILMRDLGVVPEGYLKVHFKR